MKKKIKRTSIFLGISLIVIGIVIGITIGYAHYMSTAEAINIIDLATLVTTIFLAVYIPAVMDRKLQIKRDKKQLIDDRVEELQALYRRMNLLIQGGEKVLSTKEYRTIKNTLDICQHKLDTIFILVISSPMEISFTKEMEEIKVLCSNYKELLSSPQLKDEGAYYSDDVREKEELLYNKIDKVTCLLVFKISEA